MNKTNIIERLKVIQKELEDVKDIDVDIVNNNYIINEINILTNHINDTINNIEESINDTDNYNRSKIKENIILRIFMPYIIYLSFLIKEDDMQQLLNMDNSFNESFFKEVLKKYVKQ
jgi:hypothetical protein